MGWAGLGWAGLGWAAGGKYVVQLVAGSCSCEAVCIMVNGTTPGLELASRMEDVSGCIVEGDRCKGDAGRV